MDSCKVLSFLLLIGILALAGLSMAGDSLPGAADGGACLMPAHPDLIKRLGRQEVARLHQRQYTEQMRQDLRLDRSADKAAVTGLGTPLIILWDFADHAADQINHPTAAYDSMLFSTGVYPTGSMFLGCPRPKA